MIGEEDFKLQESSQPSLFTIFLIKETIYKSLMRKRKGREKITICNILKR